MFCCRANVDVFPDQKSTGMWNVILGGSQQSLKLVVVNSCLRAMFVTTV